MWDLIVSIPEHCLSFYFVSINLLFFPRSYSLHHTSVYVWVVILNDKFRVFHKLCRSFFMVLKFTC